MKEDINLTYNGTPIDELTKTELIEIIKEKHKDYNKLAERIVRLNKHASPIRMIEKEFDFPNKQKVKLTPTPSSGMRVYTKKCKWFHKWREVKNTGKWSYQICDKCGSKRIIETHFDGYQPIDNEFLKVI
jgi:hypothetical protein